MDKLELERELAAHLQSIFDKRKLNNTISEAEQVYVLSDLFVTEVVQGLSPWLTQVQAEARLEEANLAAPPSLSVEQVREVLVRTQIEFGDKQLENCTGRLNALLLEQAAKLSPTGPTPPTAHDLTQLGFVTKEVYMDLNNKWWQAIANVEPSCDVTLVGDIDTYVHIVIEKIVEKRLKQAEEKK